MKFSNIYFFNGTAYAGKSTMVKLLAEKYDGVMCEENYHDALLSELSSEEFPNLTYTRDLKNWSDFIRRTPDQYENWIHGVTKECTVLELRILEGLAQNDKKVFVDTNIPVDVLHEISDKDHVMIMLADPEISVHRFFNSGFHVILRDEQRTALVAYNAVLDGILYFLPRQDNSHDCPYQDDRR